MKYPIVPYKSYSYFDKSYEARRHHGEIGYYYRNLLFCKSKEDREIVDKNKKHIEKIFNGLKDIVFNKEHGIRS